jgi:hypothetical protein
MEEQLKAYFVKKEEGDINLVTEVRNLLISAGLGVHVTQFYDQHPLIINSVDKVSNIQRFNLNRYWSIQLMSVNTYSEEERYCLIPNGSNEDWLKLFQIKILPFLIANNLPTAI